MPDLVLEVRNPSGLHARPAAAFVKAAGGFAADLRLANLSRNPERSVSAKSVIGVMGLGVSTGHSVRLSAEGADADAALEALGALIRSGLGEHLEPPGP